MDEVNRASPLLLIDELLDYADRCSREAQRAERAASQIARAWADHNSYGGGRFGRNSRAKYDWNRGLRLWMQGLPASEIARRVGCPRQAVAVAATRYGWPKQRDVRLDFTKAPRMVVGDETSLA